MIESIVSPQKGREKCILATNQAEYQRSTKIRKRKPTLSKKKKDLLEGKLGGRIGSGFVL